MGIFKHTLSNSNLTRCGVSGTWLNEMLNGEPGGLAMFIKEDLTFCAHDLAIINVGNQDIEVHWILVSPSF